jgi:glycosyltransferase involved in cell wall biosynthesis
VNIVLLTAPSYKEIGGVATHVYMLAKGLSELGQNVTIIRNPPNTWFRVPFIRLPETIFGCINLYFSRRYRRWMEDLYYIADVLWKTKGRIDVLNIQNVQHVGMAKLLQQATGCKIVLTVHGYLTFEAESRNWCAVGDKTHQWLWSMERNGYGRFDSIVCVARRTVKHVEQFALKPISLIPNGLDTDSFKPVGELNKESRVGGTILFSGALQEAKGIMDALKVIQILVKDNKNDLLLVIAGNGPQEAAARQYVLDNGLEKAVTFLGKVSREKMPAFYQRGCVLIFPSKQAGLSGKSEESSPYAVLEALASGVPAIAYRTGGLQEQILDGENGYLIDPGDVTGMAARTEKLITDTELLEKMGRSARKYCVQNFSHVKMAQQYMNVYAGTDPIKSG